MGFCPDSHLAVMATTIGRGRVATKDQGPRTRTVPEQGQEVSGHMARPATGSRAAQCAAGPVCEEKTISVVTVCFSEVALCGRRHEGDRRTGERPETGALLVPPSTPSVPGSGGSTGVGSAWVAVSRVPQAPANGQARRKETGRVLLV